MKTINFYKLFSGVGLMNGISLICSKILETGEKTLIFFETAQEMRQMDERLWSFSQSEFMPHMTFDAPELEEFKEDVGVVLTTEKNNIIGAENLIILKPFNDREFVKSFNKTFFLFSSEVHDELAAARGFWKEISAEKDTFASKFYEQGEDKKWKLKI